MTASDGTAALQSVAESAVAELVETYDRAFEEAAARVSLSVAQACMLSQLTELQGMSALAESAGCDASNVTRIVGRLEALGLVTREANPDDGRSRLVARTAQGDEVHRRFEVAFDFARVAVARLTAEEQDQLAGLLRKAAGHANTSARS
ncbi:MarR family winged helix-turn-helix transcriptional regulator [Microbacterium sp. PMB16]|uniref:MarR family winged helix-turn-helix transcriptional regulator n=1 Tax=Microbacterium sp. PMB16 TaxID=3120157 RepID=UPI003F4B32B8